MDSLIDAELLPTDDDVEFYRTNGYWVSPPILPPELIETALNGMERLYAGEVDQPLPDGRRQHGWKPEDGDVLRKNDYASLFVNELATLVRAPQIGACAARLAGATEIRLWHDQLLYKPVDRPDKPTNVGWHTDRQYWRVCSSADMLTAWVPFHDIGREHGGITFVAGSHRWQEDVVLDFFNPDLGTLNSLRTDHEITLAQPDIPAGAMTFHHCRTIHGSGPNRSGEPRRSIAIHMQPGVNHYVEHTLPNGEFARHGNDQLVRRTPDGRPDYSDPAVCPRLYPAG